MTPEQNPAEEYPDPRGECAFEIHRLQAALATALADHEATKRHVKQLEDFVSRQRHEIENLGYMADAVERLREIGKATGCDHVDDSDGRRQLVNCVEQVIDAAEARATAAEAEVTRVNSKLRTASDAMLAIDRVLDDKSFASRMNQLDAIRAILKQPTPLTDLAPSTPAADEQAREDAEDLAATREANADAYRVPYAEFRKALFPDEH